MKHLVLGETGAALCTVGGTVTAEESCFAEVRYHDVSFLVDQDTLRLEISVHKATFVEPDDSAAYIDIPMRQLTEKRKKLYQFSRTQQCTAPSQGSFSLYHGSQLSAIGPILDCCPKLY